MAGKAANERFFWPLFLPIFDGNEGRIYKFPLMIMFAYTLCPSSEEAEIKKKIFFFSLMLMETENVKFVGF